MPAVDMDRYPKRRGLEGPFRFRSGRIVYYDPREGAYYDSDTDMYLSQAEADALDRPRSGASKPSKRASGPEKKKIVVFR
jgi:hypothetical protein